MKKKIINTLTVILMGIFSILLLNSTDVYAATGNVTFSSEAYVCEKDNIFSVDVSISADEVIGAYYVELGYDADRMQYLGGGEFQEGDTVKLEGTATGPEVRYTLQFNALSGGEAHIEVKYAKVMTAASNSASEVSIGMYNSSAIHINGEDIVTNVEQQAEIPTYPGKLNVDDKTYYLVDLSAYDLGEEMLGLQYVEAEVDGDTIILLTNQEENAKFVYLTDNEKTLYLYGYCEEDGNLYSCEKIIDNGEIYYLTNAMVCNTWPGGLTERIVNKESVCFGVDDEGNSGFYQLTSEGEVIEWSVDSDESDSKSHKWIIILVVFIIILAVLIGILLVKKTKKREQEDEEDVAVIDLDMEDLVLERVRIDDELLPETKFTEKVVGEVKLDEAIYEKIEFDKDDIEETKFDENGIEEIKFDD